LNKYILKGLPISGGPFFCKKALLFDEKMKQYSALSTSMSMKKGTNIRNTLDNQSVIKTY